MRIKLANTRQALQNVIQVSEAKARANPGDVTAASKKALKRLEELLNTFEKDWLDDKGEVIKIGFWSWVFNGKLRRKVTETFHEVLDAISDIVSYY